MIFGLNLLAQDTISLNIKCDTKNFVKEDLINIYIVSKGDTINLIPINETTFVIPTKMIEQEFELSYMILETSNFFYILNISYWIFNKCSHFEFCKIKSRGNKLKYSLYYCGSNGYIDNDGVIIRKKKFKFYRCF